jgi:nicotinamidase-related amidase
VSSQPVTLDLFALSEIGGGAMTLEIERTSTALAAIDLQKGIAVVGRPWEPRGVEVVVGNVARLAEAFRKRGMPVFLVRVVASQADRLKVVADEQG